MARLLLVLVLAVLVAAPPAAAQDSRSFAWERFDVRVELLQDGTFWVTETQRIRFNGTFRSGFREVSLERLTSITEVQVGEPGRAYRAGQNEPGAFAVTRGDGKVRIAWWFQPTTNAARTFEVRYRVSGAIRVYEGGDQLYWVAVPADLQGPVEASEVVVLLPGTPPVDQLRAQAYLDNRPDREQPTVSSGEVRFPPRATRPGQEYEVRVQFPHGLTAATAPPWQQEYDRQAWYDSAVRPLLNLACLLAALAILAVGGVLLFLRWFTAGRDPAGGPAVSELSQAPSDLPPGLAGTVVDERADLQDVLATVLDLGNRGVIRITRDDDSSLHGSPVDYKLELLQERPLGLAPFEKTVVGALFGGRQEVRLSQVKDRWLASMPLFADQLYDEAVRRGLFPEHPDEVRKAWRGGAITLIGLAVLGFFVAPALIAAELVFLPFVAMIVVGIVVWKLGPHMPRRTKAGVVEAARWRAFARHLAKAQRDPERAPDEDLTRYLPYAVALNVDRSWLENFSRVGRRVGRLVSSNGGPVVIVGPGGWGYPGGYVGGPSYPGGSAGGPWGGDGPGGGGSDWGDRGGGGSGLDRASGGMAGGLDSMSDSLADLLSAASEALSSGGGGGWSGGGGSFGGGGSGGGGGGFN